jgi:DNA-binding NarL/FixJ family response regulator
MIILKKSEIKDENKMKSGSIVMIVAKPGSLRKGYQALLSSIPGIQTIGVVESRAAASKWMAVHHPAIALVGGNGLGDQVWSLLHQIKHESPQTRCLVIMEKVEQVQENAMEYADAIFLEGAPPEELVRIVEKLIEASGNITAAAQSGE